MRGLYDIDASSAVAGNYTLSRPPNGLPHGRNRLPEERSAALGDTAGRKRSRNVLIRLIRVNCNTQVAHNDELHDLYESDVAEEPAEIEIARPAFPSQRATSQS